MAKTGCGNMVDRCLCLYMMLTQNRRVKISDLAEELGVSYDTAYRWVELFSRHLPIEIDRGTVTTIKK